MIRDSFVLVHGGMAQNVGPILEMVTEKYLLRSEAEWKARQEAIESAALDRKGPGRRRRPRDRPAHDAELLRPHPDDHPLGIEPLHGNAHRPGARASSAADYWGFLMLGGISGGGMGFIFDPARKAEAQDFLQREMVATKRQLQYALPFAMEPVVYDFAINDRGTTGRAAMKAATR